MNKPNQEWFPEVRGNLPLSVQRKKKNTHVVHSFAIKGKGFDNRSQFRIKPLKTLNENAEKGRIKKVNKTLVERPPKRR